MTSRLAGSVVVITGASRGIGEHTARLAAARGARLALYGLEPARLSTVAGELPGGPHAWYECDVTDQHSLDEAVRSTVDTLGGIDTVVANAGVANLGTVALGPVDALVRTVEVNLIGVIRTVSATLPAVMARRGYVLLISSAAAFTVLPGMAAYCASKAGVEQFGNALRLEVAHLGVRVGTAHPSWVDTDLVRDASRDLPTFTTSRRRLPPPMGGAATVDSCARTLVDAIEKRRRRVYVPRSVALVSGLRTVALGRTMGAILGRGARTGVPSMEAEVRALGRRFGEHSAAEKAPEP
jgi:NAD(P)-dependent dehydrogenase (short-subunit alcohol dehydrogenase family)